MDDRVVKKTQDTLGKIIKKPPLTEKLLKKPPFRFLHDVVTSVIKSTGFMKGLFKDGELQSENVKEKESKITFLQKVIDLTSLAVGKSLSVKPSKIVAGHEPEKTNELLQAIAEAINKGVNNDELVKKLLSGKGESKPSKPPSGSKKERDKESSKDRESSADKRKRKEEKSGHKSKERKDDDKKISRSSDRKSSADKARDGSAGSEKRTRSKDREDRAKDHKDRDRSKEKERDREKEKESKEKERKKRKEKEEEAKENETPVVNGEATEETEEAPARIPRPSSAKGSRRRHRDGGDSSDEGDDDEDFKRQEERQRQERARKEESDMNGHAAEEEEVQQQQPSAGRRMARPSSARPAPPRIKKQDQVQEEAPNIIGVGHAPHVIVDNAQNSDDDDDQFMAKEEDTPAPPEPLEGHSQNELEVGGDHGGLVKKILETKKELEGGNKAPQAAKKKDSDKPLISDVQRRKEREMVQREIEKLRGSIQTLTRSANPLGKIMDFVQEDLDSMQKEWEMWRREHKENALALQREHSVTENSIQPLKAQLQELDQQIEEQLDLIAAVKNSITRNDEKIAKMLGSITKS